MVVITVFTPLTFFKLTAPLVLCPLIATSIGLLWLFTNVVPTDEML